MLATILLAAVTTTPPADVTGLAPQLQPPVRIEAEYVTPVEHHNPMEMFSVTVVWHGDGSLTVYDKTQSVLALHDYLSRVFGYGRHDLRVVSPFVGGAFGSALRPHYHVFLAVLAARALQRSVRIVSGEAGLDLVVGQLLQLSSLATHQSGLRVGMSCGWETLLPYNG